MADNEQNTYSGGAGPIAAPTGNGFLDAFLRIANVAAVGVGVYEDSQDRKAAREIERLNAANKPQQTLPASQANSPLDYVSNPAAIQAMAFYGVAFAVIGGLSIWALKKL